jgi:hypothetical protein
LTVLNHVRKNFENSYNFDVFNRPFFEYGMTLCGNGAKLKIPNWNLDCIWVTAWEKKKLG